MVTDGAVALFPPFSINQSLIKSWYVLNKLVPVQVRTDLGGTEKHSDWTRQKRRILKYNSARASIDPLSDNGNAIMFWKNDRNELMDAVQEGGLFQRKHSHNMLETARVLSIGEDQFGIPHVKYEVKFESSQERDRAFEGPRVLALAVFADNYHNIAEAV